MRLASKHPGLMFVIDHVGLNVGGKGPKVFEDRLGVGEWLGWPLPEAS
jgi:hypothetical protein